MKRKTFIIISAVIIILWLIFSYIWLSPKSLGSCLDNDYERPVKAAVKNVFSEETTLKEGVDISSLLDNVILRGPFLHEKLPTGKIIEVCLPSAQSSQEEKEQITFFIEGKKVWVNTGSKSYFVLKGREEIRNTLIIN